MHLEGDLSNSSRWALVVSASVSVAEGISESSSAFVSASRVSQLPDLAVILAVKDEINDFGYRC
jgi:hypothetical protein